MTEQARRHGARTATKRMEEASASRWRERRGMCGGGADGSGGARAAVADAESGSIENEGKGTD